MKVKVNEASGPVLDWMVSKCVGALPKRIHRCETGDTVYWVEYSTDWAQGGPIIEREKLGVWWDGVWHAKYDGCRNDEVQDADTPLIAVMRCYVASKLGEELEVPDELA